MSDLIPGEIDGPNDNIIINAGKEQATATVINSGDRPIQVGSHYHFAETNPALLFDRQRTQGFRLDIAAGTSVRFEPGIEVDVVLVALGGRRFVPGLRGETAGSVDSSHPLDTTAYND